MKTDEELIAEAIAAGKVTKVPAGVSSMPIGTIPSLHERCAIIRRNRARAARIRAAMQRYGDAQHAYQ